LTAVSRPYPAATRRTFRPPGSTRRLFPWKSCVNHRLGGSPPKVWLDCVRIYLGLGLFIRGVFIITNTRAEFILDLLKRMEFPGS